MLHPVWLLIPAPLLSSLNLSSRLPPEGSFAQLYDNFVDGPDVNQMIVIVLVGGLCVVEKLLVGCKPLLPPPLAGVCREWNVVLG